MFAPTRDAPPRSAAHEISLKHRDVRLPPHAGERGSHSARLVTVLQIAGSLLAIPVGLASGYSVYRANFSPEITCQSLRANIVGMLDKSLDPSALRTLVRRDVENFERSCGSVDPDASAAFKTLLSAERPAPRVIEMVQPEPKDATVEPQPNTSAKADAPVKAEPAPARVVAPARPPVASAAKTPRRDAVVQNPASDAAWLAGVRQALQPTEAHVAAPVSTPSPAPATIAPAAPAIAQPPAGAPLPLNADAVAASPVEQQAPALPPVQVIAPAPQAAPQIAPDVNHPVPPAPIPEAAQAQTRTASRGGFLSHIPFIGRALDR